MPGKHAPASSASFLSSLARWVGAGAAGIAVVVVVILLLVGGGAKKEAAKPNPSPATSGSASSSPSTRLRASVTVAVYNAKGAQGLARRVADQLQNDGYDVVTVDSTAHAAKTTIYYQSGAADDAAALLAAHPEFGRILPAKPDQTKKALIIVVLGADYAS
ncbi:MAG: LytR C-terminal domain-containing protein [Actinomycetota bacterium]